MEFQICSHDSYLSPDVRYSTTGTAKAYCVLVSLTPLSVDPKYNARFLIGILHEDCKY